MKRLNLVNQENKSISPTFVNLCVVIHQAMQHADAYRRRKEQRNRTNGKLTNRTNSIIQMLL